MALQSIQDLNAPVSSWLGSLENWQEVIGQIESELYNSEIYQQVMVRLQAKLGELAGEAQCLIKNISREAIRLAFQQLASQPGSQEIRAAETPDHGSEARDIPDRQPPTRNTAGERSPRLRPISSRQAKQKLQQEERYQERRVYLQQVGQAFQQRRQQQGISLDQLHALTRIPVHQLQALELGKIEALPESIYIRSFVRKIGQVLGVDGDRLANAIPDAEPQEGLLPCWSKQPSSTPIYLSPVYLYAGYAALVAGAMGGLNWVSQQSAPLPPMPEFVPSSTTQHSAKPAVTHTQMGLATTQNIAPPEVAVFQGR